MDYTAFGLAGLSLLVCLVSAVVAAHRGGTMRLRLPFVDFDGGKGFALTKPVRAMFAALAFAALGCAGLIAAGSLTGDGSGAGDQAAGSKPAPAVTTVTSTVTVPAGGQSDGGSGGSGQADEASQNGGSGSGDSSDDGSSGNGNSRLVKAWSTCEFQLHGRDGSLSVSGDTCTVAGDAAEVYVGSLVSGEISLSVPSGYTSVWEKSKRPTAEECRKSIETGGDEGGGIDVGENPNGRGICARLSSGNRYVYIRFTEVDIEDWNTFTISGTATAWDVVR